MSKARKRLITARNLDVKASLNENAASWRDVSFNAAVGSSCYLHEVASKLLAALLATFKSPRAKRKDRISSGRQQAVGLLVGLPSGGQLNARNGGKPRLLKHLCRSSRLERGDISL